MKRAIYLLPSVFLIVVFLVSCSQDQNPLPSKAHPESWNTIGSNDFHGLKVLEVGFESCTSCHGKNYEGGESKVSCFKCHESYPHDEGWVEKSEFSHDVYLKAAEWNIADCADCHGESFEGGKSQVSCFTCHDSYPHDEEWLISSSEQFHGTYSKNKEFDNSNCADCHGGDFQGGSSEVSCYTCHNSYPHNETWIAGSDNSHGLFLKEANWTTESCSSCHGADLSGGSSEVSCTSCHNAFPHAAGWLDQASDQFHGTYLEDKAYDTSSCTLCHGQDYRGGNAGVSCYSCHQPFPHAEGWTSSTSDQFHGQFIRAENWSLESCKTCHGEDYRGAETGVSCYTCHTGDQGPETCNTCHGSSENFAPPQDLNNNTEVTAPGVGRHQLHVGLFNTCTLCHEVPSTVSDPGHIDDTPGAEVLDSWGYNRETATCAFSCHTDPEKEYIWNAP